MMMWRRKLNRKSWGTNTSVTTTPIETAMKGEHKQKSIRFDCGRGWCACFLTFYNSFNHIASRALIAYCGSIAWWYLINKSEPLNLIYSNKCQQIVLHSQHTKIKNLKRKKNQTFLSCRSHFWEFYGLAPLCDMIFCVWIFLHAISIFVIIFHLWTRERVEDEIKKGRKKIIEHETTFKRAILLNEKKNVDANIWSLIFNEFFSFYGQHRCCEECEEWERERLTKWSQQRFFSA